MRDSKQITECLFSHSGSWNTADVLSTVVHKRLGGLAALPSLTYVANCSQNKWKKIIWMISAHAHLYKLRTHPPGSLTALYQKHNGRCSLLPLDR